MKNLKTKNSLKTWKVIQIGTYKSASKLWETLDANEVTMNYFVSQMLHDSNFRFHKRKKEVELVILSVAELGFPKGATTKNIYDKALKLGLKLCLPEVGPLLRLQYKDQPNEETLRIAMKPIPNSSLKKAIFYVNNGTDNNGLQLHGIIGSPLEFWEAGKKWIFCKR